MEKKMEHEMETGIIWGIIVPKFPGKFFRTMTLLP